MHITLLLYALGQIGRINIDAVKSFYVYEIALGIWILYLMIVYKLTPLKKAIKCYKWTYRFFIFLSLGLIFSYGFSAFRSNVTATLYFIRLLAYFVWFIYMRHHIAHNGSLRGQTKKIILFFFVWLALTAVTQLLFYPDLRNLMYLGWDPHLNRIVGLMLEPPISGAIYGLTILYLYIYIKKNLLRNIAMTFFLIFIFFTYSRGTYLAVAATSAVIILRFSKLTDPLIRSKVDNSTRKRHMDTLVIIVLVIALVALMFIPQEGEGMNLLRTSTVYSRFYDYKEAMGIFARNPLIGIGYNQIGSYKESVTTTIFPNHSAASFQSSFLIVLVTGGVVGLVLFFLMLYEIMNINLLSEYVFLFLSIASLTDNVMLHPFILFYSFLLVALIPDSLNHPSGIR